MDNDTLAKLASAGLLASVLYLVVCHFTGTPSNKEPVLTANARVLPLPEAVTKPVVNKEGISNSKNPSNIALSNSRSSDVNHGKPQLLQGTNQGVTALSDGLSSAHADDPRHEATQERNESKQAPWPLDADGISGAVSESLPQIQGCYAAWLKANPALKGKVKVAFTIERVKPKDESSESTGTLTGVQIRESSLNNKLLEGCIASVMASLRFEAPESDKMVVTYPLTFEPQD